MTSKLDKLVEACSITNGLPTTQVNGNGHGHGNGMNGMSNGHVDPEEDVYSATPPEGEARSSSGQVDLLVAGAGTGGSITGMSKRLKEEWPGEEGTRVLGVDPVGSLLALPESLNELKEGESDFYAVEGIGMSRFCGTPTEMSIQAETRSIPLRNLYRLRLCTESTGSLFCG